MAPLDSGGLQDPLAPLEHLDQLASPEAQEDPASLDLKASAASLELLVHLDFPVSLDSRGHLGCPEVTGFRDRKASLELLVDLVFRAPLDCLEALDHKERLDLPDLLDSQEDLARQVNEDSQVRSHV